MKHGDLFRRQCSLALLAPHLALSLASDLVLLAPCMAPDLALGMARLSSCLAPGLDRHSVSHRPSTGHCYRRPYHLPGYSSRNDCPANRGHEAIGDGELGFRQAGLDAAPNHVQGSRSHRFDVLGQVQRFRQQGIAGHRAVRFTQLLQRERRRKAAGVPHFGPVREEHDLHAAVVRVVAMCHGVDDGFGHDFRRDLVHSGSTGALRPRADGSVNLAEHEVHRLIDQLEHRALVDLVRRNRLGDLGSVIVGAPDLRGHEKSLRRPPEQKYGGVR